METVLDAGTSDDRLDLANSYPVIILTFGFVLLLQAIRRKVPWRVGGRSGIDVSPYVVKYPRVDSNH